MSAWKILAMCAVSLAACAAPLDDGSASDLGVTQSALVSGAQCDPLNAASVASPVERAMLDTIAWTEGTRGHGKDGYNVTFAYRYFDSCEEHPNLKICSGSLCSTAAGRYQFLYKTFTGLKLPNFWPEQQELGALELIERRGVDLPDAPMTATQFANALDRLSYEWSSLPPGRYGTPRHTLSEIRAEYCQLAGCGAMFQPLRRDFVAIEDDGVLYRYAPNEAGDFSTAPISSEWETALAMGAGADYNEDGQRDFVSFDLQYGLELYSGDGEDNYWYEPISFVSDQLRLIGAGADYDRDGHADFITVDDAGQLLIARGDGNGTFVSAVIADWARDTTAIGGGADYSGDNFADFVLRDATNTWLYLGDGAGGFSQQPLVLEGAAPRLFAGAGDYTGDGQPDLFAVADDGSGQLYEGLGNTDFVLKQLGGGWDAVRFID
ncbi:MAG TPA: FG-GAP-like repeat-containing protein [Polyangiales bacterium]|nr:FG-GAP-like repeat-containing protein [Polyangiales bacterium]